MANAYSAFSPAMNVAQALCTSNGQTIPCSPLIATFGIGLVVALVVVVLVMVVSLWKIFTKAGQPGWASIIPIYNTVVILEPLPTP